MMKEQDQLLVSTALTLREFLQRLAEAKTITDVNIAAGIALDDASNPATYGRA